MKPGAKDILKVRITKSVFDVDALCIHTRYVYEILPDGEIIYSIKERG